ncbi:MAG: hypothetical protein IT436_14200 [Phycisphaerales bacterium]|nr:hypothetical protein [Phycisphaerales bacterium]
MSPITTSSASTSPSPAPAPGEWHAETLVELREQLLWPGLLRTPALALSPSRLGMAFFTLLLLAFLWELSTLWISGPGPLDLAGERITAAVLGVAEGLGLMAPGPARESHPFLTAAGDLFYRAPAALFASHPWTSVILLPPTLLIWCIGFGAICRSAACEFAQAFLLPWPRAIAFALSRWGSLVAAVLAPLILIGVIALVIAGGGALLLTWPVGDLIAAVLSPIAIILSGVAVFGLAGYILGQKLIIPAVVCEGTDSIDAIQRTYAYVLGRPVLLIIYLLVLAVAAGLALAAAAALVTGITSFAVSAALHWSGPRGADILRHAPGLSGTAGLASGIIRIVLAIPAGLVAAYGLSMYASGSTILYLLLRQANDGQEPGELWMPGMIDGTMAQAPVQADEDDDES